RQTVCHLHEPQTCGGFRRLGNAETGRLGAGTLVADHCLEDGELKSPANQRSSRTRGRRWTGDLGVRALFRGSRRGNRNSAGPYDQIRLDGYGARIPVRLVVQPAQQRFGSYNTHLPKGLAYCGERRVLESRALNVVETDDGNVLWYTLAGLPKGADG